MDDLYDAINLIIDFNEIIQYTLLVTNDVMYNLTSK